MKVYERKRKKSGRKEPFSYIYKERNEYIPPTRRGMSYWFKFIVRMAFVIKLLSATGVINPILEKFRKENIVIST